MAYINFSSNWRLKIIMGLCAIVVNKILMMKKKKYLVFIYHGDFLKNVQPSTKFKSFPCYAEITEFLKSEMLVVFNEALNK